MAELEAQSKSFNRLQNSLQMKASSGSEYDQLLQEFESQEDSVLLEAQPTLEEERQALAGQIETINFKPEQLKGIKAGNGEDVDEIVRILSNIALNRIFIGPD